MRQFLTRHGIAANRLIEETDSVDTVGNAVFTGLLLKQKKINPKNILLITSDFHAPRALFLFRNILGGGRNIAVTLAQSSSETLSARISNELRSQAATVETFFSYSKLPGSQAAQRVDDIESALYQLILQHDLYKNRWDLLRRYERKY
jgi:vancomycin permeability regulator SanA